MYEQATVRSIVNTLALSPSISSTYTYGSKLTCWRFTSPTFGVTKAHDWAPSSERTISVAPPERAPGVWDQLPAVMKMSPPGSIAIVGSSDVCPIHEVFATGALGGCTSFPLVWASARPPLRRVY